MIIFVAILGSAVAATLLLILSPYLFVFHNPADISLNVSANSTTISQNETIQLTIADKNNSPFTNEFDPSEGFDLQMISQQGGTGPCGILYPFGVVVFQGNYDLGNLSSGKSIEIFNLYAPEHCPLGGAHYPSSLRPYGTLSKRVAISGYWTSGSELIPGRGISDGILHPLVPGRYTAFVGDAWGRVELVHFTVTG
jgi:hypothetical protein